MPENGFKLAETGRASGRLNGEGNSPKVPLYPPKKNSKYPLLLGYEVGPLKKTSIWSKGARFIQKESAT